MIDLIHRCLAHRTALRIGSAALGMFGLVLLAQVLVNMQPSELRMSAGPAGTRRHAVAEYLGQQARHHNLSITLEPNAGSEHCLEQLKTGKLDAALVSSGVVVPEDDDIVVLAAAQLEAVHLLVRKSLAHQVSVLQAIHGKRINLGERGSTEWLLARELLAFARLKPPTAANAGDYIPLEYGKAALLAKADAILRADSADKEALIAELPDALIVLASMPSTVVQQFVEVADYEIVPLPAARAFLLDNLQAGDPSETMLQREFLERAVIPMHSYFAGSGFPTADCDTLGVRLLVVARKDLPARAVRSLMETLFEGEFSRRILPRSPRELSTPYAIHSAAQAYLDREKPLAVGAAVEWISKALSLFGAFSAGALSLYGLLRRKKIRKPSDYYAEIRQIDAIASGDSVDATLPSQAHERAIYLQERLHALRHDLIEDICEGRIKGDQVIANILSLINDARRNVPKLSATSGESGYRPTLEVLSTQKAA